MRMMKKPIQVTAFNSVPALYSNVLQLQETLFQRRKLDSIQDIILLLQHSPVYTIGKRGSTEDFKSDKALLESRGIEIVEVPRGGETTYHGPGQIIAYPIVHLRQLRLGPRVYVEALEDAMIATAKDYGVKSKGRIPGKTGVWVEDRKIGSIGVAISGGVTRHGIAFNAAPNLAAFDDIIACGDPHARVTSLRQELGKSVNVEHVAHRLAHHIMQNIGHDPDNCIQLADDVHTLIKTMT